MFISSPSYSVLSTSTANTIQGTKPYLLLSDGVTKVNNLTDLFGFTMPDGSGGTLSVDASMAATTINVPTGMSYNDVVALITADGNPHDVSGVTVDDLDGDAVVASNVNIFGSITATWYNNNSKVSSSILSQALESCGGVYTLIIKADNVGVSTTYGDPNTNHYGSHSGVTYKFIVPQTNGGCITYLKPAEISVRSGQFIATSLLSKYPYVDSSNPGGYNPSKWEYDSSTTTHKGFKVGSGFPETGFYKASFSLIGSRANQSNYKCTLDSSNMVNWVTLSGAASSSQGEGCSVTYNTVAKPTNPIKINMYYNDSGTLQQIDSFIINVPTKWARVLNTSAYKTDSNTQTSGSFTAANECAGSNLGIITPATAASYFYGRQDFTNTPVAHGNGLNGYFSRDVDGTFTGEWGSLYIGYSGSRFEQKNVIWTHEQYDVNNHFVIHTFDGDQSHLPLTDYNVVVVCRN